MDKKLAQHKWQAFVLDEVFDIRATQSSIDKKNLVNIVGTIPYITRSDKNNGIDMFIGEQPKYKKDEGNVLTIGLDTQTIFYQPIPFYTGQNIQVIRHPRMNRYNASFLIVAIKILLQKFNWGGNGATLTRLKRSKVFLPITDKKEIDWQFMEEYMRRKETLLLKPAVEKLCKRLIHKEILGGVNCSALNGNILALQKCSQKYSVVSVLKKQTTQKALFHTYHPQHSTMVWMDLLATKAA